MGSRRLNNSLSPLVRRLDTRAVKPEPKFRNPFYVSAEYLAWREVVLARAGRRCQAIEHGLRCTKAEAKGDRLFADHDVELADGGAALDPANGVCMCGRHHTLKTIAARVDRLRS